MKKLLLLFISALLAVSVQAQSNDKPGNWKLIRQMMWGWLLIL